MATKTDILRIRLEQDGAGNLRAQIAGIGDETDQFRRKTESATRQAGLLRNALVGVAGALSVSSIVSTIVEFERLSASLVTVTGSTREANAVFNQLKEFSQQTPFQLQEVVDAFIKLKALGLDPSQEALLSYANTASAMGKSLNQFIEAVADAATGEFERLKEFGIKARTQGDQVAFIFQNQTTVVRKNALEIEGYLRRIGQTQFAGAVEQQMETLGGSFSNLQDAASQFAAALGESGLSSALKGAASFLTFMANEGRGLTQVILPLVSGLAAARILGPIFAGITGRAIAMAGALRTAAGAATVLRAGMAFLGGPAGLIIGVATALSFYAGSASAASVDTEDLAKEVQALTGQYQKLKQSQIEETISKVTLAIQQYKDEIARINTNAVAIGQPLGQLDQTQISERIDKIKDLAIQLQLLQKELDKAKNRDQNNNTNQGDPFGDKAAQREAQQQLKRLEAFRRSQLIEQQLIKQSEYEKQAIVQGFLDQGLIDADEYFDLLEGIQRESAERRKAIEQDVNDTIYASRVNVYQQAANLARVFAGESRAAALVALAIEKGLAVSQTLIQGQVAAAKARAALIIPGNPASVAYAEAQAQRIIFNSRLAAALIGATGLAQASQVGSGGASSGSAANPIYTQQTTQSSQPQSDSGRGEIVQNNYFIGDIYGEDEFLNRLERGNKRLSDQDRIVVQSNSRNALDLVDR